jgi:hypothetical protein
MLLRASSLALGLALLSMSGCVSAPDSAAWKPDEGVIQPGGADPRAPGSLVVETVFLGRDNGFERRRPFFLYDEQGRYLTHYQNDSMSPIVLAPGRYVVVTSLLMTNRRVQVVIRDGMTTRVRLADFKSAPEAS